MALARVFVALFACVCLCQAERVRFCPCESAHAVPATSLLQTALFEPVDANATGTLEDDGSVDLTSISNPDVERDSVCVCKRLKKPKAPVRCTKPSLLHENCGERDMMRAAGYDVAPPDQLTTLYPDEIPVPVPPPAGKVFKDALVEKSAVENLAVEDKTVVGHLSSHTKPANKHVFLSASEVTIDSTESAEDNLDGEGNEQQMEDDGISSTVDASTVSQQRVFEELPASSNTLEAAVQSLDNAGEVAWNTKVEEPVVADVQPAVDDSAPATSQDSDEAPLDTTQESDSVQSSEDDSAPIVPVDAVEDTQEKTPAPLHGGPGFEPPSPVASSKEDAEVTTESSSDSAESKRDLEGKLEEQARETETLKAQLETLKKQMEAMVQPQHLIALD